MPKHLLPLAGQIAALLPTALPLTCGADVFDYLQHLPVLSLLETPCAGHL